MDATGAIIELKKWPSKVDLQRNCCIEIAAKFFKKEELDAENNCKNLTRRRVKKTHIINRKGTEKESSFYPNYEGITGLLLLGQDSSATDVNAHLA